MVTFYQYWLVASFSLHQSLHCRYIGKSYLGRKLIANKTVQKEKQLMLVLTTDLAKPRPLRCVYSTDDRCDMLDL